MDLYPKVLYFNVTNRCNLNCIHCAVAAKYSKPIKNITELNLKEIVEDVVPQLLEIGVSSIYLSGGEPLLRKDIFDIIRCFSSQGIAVRMATNSTLITKAVAKKLKNSGISGLSTSIDGISSTHDKFRNKLGAFDMTIRGIKNAQEEDIYVSVNTTVYSGNYADVEQLVNFVKELNVLLRLSPMCAIGRAKNLQNETITPEQLIKLVEFVSRIRKEKYNVLINVPPALLPMELLDTAGECGWAEFLCGLSPDGNISICPMTDGYPEFIAGNIRKNRLKEIWVNSHIIKEFKDLRANISKRLKGICGKCKVNDLCKGGCRIVAYNEYGEIDSPFPICQQMYEAGYFPKFLIRP